MPKPTMPCELCGLSTRSRYGVCSRPGCRNESARRQHSDPTQVSYQDCDICGAPTSSLFGVCSRPGDCEREWKHRRWVAGHPGRVEPKPCDICGAPTASRVGVCVRTRECGKERDHRVRGRTPNPSVPCKVCGRITDAAAGVCKMTIECRRERDRRKYVPRPGNPSPCEVCGGPTESKYGVCQKTTECRREFVARRRAADPEANREARRQYRLRPDRPCRYARAGCTTFAEIGLLCCREHQRADQKRTNERRRRKMTLQLAEAQDWICTWCSKPLPEDLKRTEIDHVIPKSSGLIIEDDWNLHILHKSCNGAKHSKITDFARALAAEHGIALPAAA